MVRQIKLSAVILSALLVTSIYIALTPHLYFVHATAPTENFTWSPEMPLINETVTFDASASYDPDGGKILSYAWDFGDGVKEVVSRPIITHTYTAYGSYTVNLTITDDQLEKAWLTKSITVRWYPEATFAYSPERPLVHENVTFDASASKPNGGTIVLYYWDFGDGTKAKVNVPTITHAYAAVGNFTVSLIVEDSEGLNSTAYSKIVTVINPPRAEFTYSPSYPIVGQTVTFDASASKPDGGTILWYYWDFGDGTILNVTTAVTTHVYNIYGNYTVKLIIGDSEGLNDTVSKALSVRQYPKANFIYAPALPLVNETVTFNASASTPEGGIIIEYSWDFGDGSTAKGVVVSHAYVTYGTFTVTLTVTDSEGLSDTYTKTIRIAIHPVAKFTHTPVYPVINQPVLFNASASYDPDRTIMAYTWDFGDGNVTTTTQPLIYHTYTVADVYNVTLTVTDDDNLKGATWKLVPIYTSVPTHDVAIKQVTPSLIRVVSGSTIYINVTAENQGTDYENFTITVYYDNNLIGKQTILNMPPLTEQTVKFYWNTSGVAIGHYVIKATASVVVDEVDTADNVKLADQKVEIGPLVWMEVEPVVTKMGLVNKTFNVDIVIRNLEVVWRAVGVQFRLCYNDTLLEVMNVTQGPFMQDARWNLHGTFFIYYVEKDSIYGPHVLVGIMLYPNETGYWNAYPYGDGVLVTITFKAICQERGLEKPPLTSDLKLLDTMIIDEDLIDIPFKSKDGIYEMYPTNIGDFNFDGKVDMKDIARVARAFGSSLTTDTQRWDATCDVNNDNKIDMRDIAIVARNFGWTTIYDP